MDIRQRLHLSGMDSHAPELARKWGLGLEVTDFCYAPMLDDPATLPAVREKMAGIDHFWLHAPFAELAPCAVDPLVREVTARRYRQALSAARQLGIRRLVIHSGYIPLVYFPEWFTEQSVAFWREFLPEVPEDMVLALENVMDETPQLMTDIVRQVDDPRLGLCLDVGHANSCASRTPPLDWIAPMAPYLRHVHLHNNLGDWISTAVWEKAASPCSRYWRRCWSNVRRPHGPSEIRTAPRPLHGWCGRAILVRSNL